MSTGLITELEVVNSVLSATGDAPVQSLDDGYQPTFIIREMIKNISRDMQSMKYWFNTEYGVTLPTDFQTNRIVLPNNLLHFEPQDTRYVARGTTVYDRTDRTNTIKTDIIADITVMLAFDELPQTARKFIQESVKLQYNVEYLGDDSIRRVLEQSVMKAQIDLDRVNIENEDINIFGSATTTGISGFYRQRRF